MGFFDKIFGKKSSADIDSNNVEQSVDSIENVSREISYSMKYWIDWKPKSKIKDWSKTTCCYVDESGERYKHLCKRLYDLDRVYTRAEIESISLKLGYSVYDNIGGSEDCCCYWNSAVMHKIKK